jgi:hypothetical protein
MTIQEFNKETEVYQRFIEGLKSSQLSIKSQDKWKTPLMTRWFDMVIYQGNYPFAFIEVKESLENKTLLLKQPTKIGQHYQLQLLGSEL